MIGFKRKTRSGMTLAETLAALALLAVVGPVLGRVWVSVVQRSGAMADEMVAARLAQSKLDEYLDDAADTDELSGDFSPKYPGFNWEIDSDSWSEDSRFEQVVITVSWANGQNQKSFVIAGLQYGSGE